MPVTGARTATLSLCMIVRNEERHLEACLQSARDVVDEIIVVDTGSTDQTVAIAERYGATLLHHAWTGDFSAARNVSLRAATCDWILVLDADERLTEASKPELLRLLETRGVAGYSLICESLIGTGNGDQFQRSPVFRLILNRPDIRFEGMIHEQAIGTANRTGLQTCASTVTIRHLGYTASEIALRDKRQRNLAILERQAELEPQNPFVLFNLGEVLKLLQRHAEAEQRYTQALALLKASQASMGISYVSNLYFSLGDLYRELKDFEKGHALLDEALALYPAFVDLYYTKGFTYFDQGRYHDALAQFARCQEFRGAASDFATDPEVPGPKAARAMADCYIRLDDRPQAKICMEEALRLSARPAAELHTNLGILYQEAGEEALALQQFTLAVDKNPQEARAWLNLGMLWIQRGEYQEAVKHWERRPDDEACRSLLCLGLVLADQGLPDDRPRDEVMTGAWCDVMEVLLLGDRLQPVQDLLDRLETLGGELPLEAALGQVLARNGHHAAAIDCLLLAQRRTAGDPAIYRALGDSCLALGNASDAKVMYLQALELAPADPHSLGQLQRLG